MSTFEVETKPAAEFPYQRLKPGDGWFQDEEAGDGSGGAAPKPRPVWQWQSRFRRIPLGRRRFRLRIPGLRRFLSRRRFGLVSAGKLLCRRVVKRLKHGRVHFGDLFAGNYLFMQINPAPLRCTVDKHGKRHVLDPSAYTLSWTV